MQYNVIIVILSHWGWVMNINISEMRLVIIGLGNGLLLVQHQVMKLNQVFISCLKLSVFLDLC